ncbi:Lipoma HMGIC fusion partner [Apis cerana cerana]|uniref:Lipoma HMGIC fusion partner n=1 Tax=Apis cerana cerana TaxID=94128 RepID=A0A2A3ECQ6_APICC|nr:Lipoma HMGIC fusion partner [Apis cerana cerana]
MENGKYRPISRPRNTERDSDITLNNLHQDFMGLGSRRLKNLATPPPSPSSVAGPRGRKPRNSKIWLRSGKPRRRFWPMPRPCIPTVVQTPMTVITWRTNAVRRERSHRPGAYANDFRGKRVRRVRSPFVPTRIQKSIYIYDVSGLDDTATGYAGLEASRGWQEQNGGGWEIRSSKDGIGGIQLNGSMCYVIVTGRSLLWTLLSLVALMAVLSGLITPKWLIGPQMKDTKNGSESYVPTVGIFNRCIRLHGKKTHCANFNLDGFATDSSVFPGCWKASYFFLSFGLAIMAMTVLAALVGCCMQSIGRKSIFNLAGVAQVIAAGWGAERVQRICGSEADAFYLAECSLGWAFYSAVIGVGLTFICAVISGQAEKSTASDKVQDKMNEGKTLICLA